MSVEHITQRADTSRWARRNVWRLPSGEPCVRPGLRNVLSADGGRKLVGGFTVDGRDEVWHYVFDVSSTTGADLRLRIYDDDFNVFSAVAIQATGIPRAISYAVVEGQILIGSPDFPTMWGRVEAATVIVARKQDSISGQTVLEVPRGIVTRWSNRAVIANGPSLFVSDPVAATGGDLRSFIGPNQNNRPAPVYGVHEAAGGMLVAVTADGVWGLDVGGAAAGIVGSNGADWRVLSHHRAISYDSSCTVRGRLFVLTRRGWTLADVSAHEEQTLDDEIQSRRLTARAQARDYRACRIYGSDDGPIVANDAQALIHLYDMGRPLAAWWSAGPSSGVFRGTLRNQAGLQMLIFDDMVCAVDGNVDDTAAPTLPLSSPTYPEAVLAGVLPAPAHAIDRLRHLHVVAALSGYSGEAIRSSIGGETAVSTSPDAPSGGITLGTTAWGAASARYQANPMSSFRFDADFADEIGVEVGISGGMSRIDDAIASHVERTGRPEEES